MTFVEASEGVGLDTLFETVDAPPPARPVGHGQLIAVGVGPGRTAGSSCARASSSRCITPTP
jgi:hypothetical protein